MAAGLSAEQAAKTLGVARATLYRWEKKPEAESRRPHTARALGNGPASGRRR
jgi:DNA-binding XRE family transcriptional regulator